MNISMETKIRDNQVTVLEFIPMLFSSIRTLDVRIDELMKGIKENLFRPEINKHIIERISQLLDTRLKLIYSILDCKNSLNKELGTKIQFSYKDFKRSLTYGK